MKRAYVVGILTAVVGTFLGLASCSEDTTTLPPGGAKDTGIAGGDTNVTTDSNVSPDAPKSDTRPEGGGDGCPATIKHTGKIAEMRNPAKVIPNDGVQLNGVVVTSIKWRTRNPSASFKSCLYSIFVADPNATFAPWSGMQIIAYGDDPKEVTTDSGVRYECDDTSDPIPKDIKVGDVIDVTGTYTEFGPTSAACGGAMPTPLPLPNPDKAPQVRACRVNKTGTGTAPAPATVTPAQIANGSTELLQWAGGRVKVVNVEASAAGNRDSFGNFPIKDSSLFVSDIVWYRGTYWNVASGAKFDEIVGHPLIDFCTWSLAPSFCSDAKASTGTNINCPAPMTTDAGTSDADGG